MKQDHLKEKSEQWEKETFAPVDSENEGMARAMR